MIKNLYYAYVGIRSLRPDLPFNKANESSAIAPLPAKVMHLLSIADQHRIWLDDIYLNLHIPAASILSRFTESEDITRRIYPSTPMIQCNSPSGSHTPGLGQMHRTDVTINQILFLPSKTKHPRSTHPAVTFIWRILHIIFMVDLTAWPPPPNDPRTKKQNLHEVCPTHSHRQETSPASRSSKLIVFADDSASTFRIPSTELKLHDIVRICLHHIVEIASREIRLGLLLEPSAETARVQSDAYRERPDDNRKSKFSLSSNAYIDSSFNPSSNQSSRSSSNLSSDHSSNLSSHPHSCPSLNPFSRPSCNPSPNPSPNPSSNSSSNPSSKPSHNPSSNPSSNQSNNPSIDPIHPRIQARLPVPCHPNQDPIHWRNPAKTRLAKSNPSVNPFDALNCTPTECPSNKPSSNPSKKTRPQQIRSIRDTQLGPQDPIPAPAQAQIPN